MRMAPADHVHVHVNVYVNVNVVVDVDVNVIGFFVLVAARPRRVNLCPRPLEICCKLRHYPGHRTRRLLFSQETQRHQAARRPISRVSTLQEKIVVIASAQLFKDLSEKSFLMPER